MIPQPSTAKMYTYMYLSTDDAIYIFLTVTVEPQDLKTQFGDMF